MCLKLVVGAVVPTYSLALFRKTRNCGMGERVSLSSCRLFILDCVLICKWLLNSPFSHWRNWWKGKKETKTSIQHILPDAVNIWLLCSCSKKLGCASIFWMSSKIKLWQCLMQWHSPSSMFCLTNSHHWQVLTTSFLSSMHWIFDHTKCIRFPTPKLALSTAASRTDDGVISWCNCSIFQKTLSSLTLKSLTQNPAKNT